MWISDFLVLGIQSSALGSAGMGNNASGMVGSVHCVVLASLMCLLYSHKCSGLGGRFGPPKHGAQHLTGTQDGSVSFLDKPVSPQE